MNQKEPLVSIGLPVYNGENYIHGALQSLLKQDYSNFELIISDNASTDKTSEICRDYQKRDERIKFYCNNNNCGAAFNFNKVYNLAKGKYFMWAAHDDLWANTYIRKCVDKAAVLCCSEIMFIDEFGQDVGRKYRNLNTVGMDWTRRVHEFILRDGWYAIYGLIRKQVLQKTRLFSTEYGTDVILLMELLLLGEFAKVEEPLFAYRVIPHSKTAEDYIFQISSNRVSQEVPMPYTGMARNLLKVISNSSLNITQKKELQYEFIEALSSQRVGLHKRILKEGPLSTSQVWSPCQVREYITTVLMAENLEEGIKNYNINGFCIKKQLKDRPVYIWGTGKAGHDVLSWLKENDITITGFLDSDRRKWDTATNGLSIHSPEILKKKAAAKPFVIIGSMYVDEIKRMLIDWEYQWDQDFI